MVFFEAINLTAEQQSIKSKSDNQVSDKIKELRNLYLDGLDQLREQNIEESKRIFENIVRHFEATSENRLLAIIQTQVLEDECSQERDTCIELLKCTYRNLGEIYEKENEQKVKKIDYKFLNLEHSKASEFFSKALKLDGEDIQLWFKLGENYRLSGLLKNARDSYEQGIRVGTDQESLLIEGEISPFRIVIMIKLIEVLYSIGDFLSCKRWIDLILSIYPNTPKVIQIKNSIDYIDIQIPNQREFLPLTTFAKESDPPVHEINLDKLTFSSIGSALFNEFKEERDNKEHPYIRKILKVTYSNENLQPTILEENKCQIEHGFQASHPEIIDLDSSQTMEEEKSVTVARSVKRTRERVSRSSTKKLRLDQGIVDLNKDLMKLFFEANSGPSAVQDWYGSVLSELAQSNDVMTELGNILLNPLFSNFSDRFINNIEVYDQWKSNLSCIFDQSTPIEKPYICGQGDFVGAISNKDFQFFMEFVKGFIDFRNDDDLNSIEWLIGYITSLFRSFSDRDSPWICFAWSKELKNLVSNILLNISELIYPNPIIDGSDKETYKAIISICEILVWAKYSETSGYLNFENISSSYIDKTLSLWLACLETQLTDKEDLGQLSTIRLLWLKASKSRYDKNFSLEITYLTDLDNLLEPDHITPDLALKTLVLPNCEYGSSIDSQSVKSKNFEAKDLLNLEILKSGNQEASEAITHIRDLYKNLKGISLPREPDSSVDANEGITLQAQFSRREVLSEIILKACDLDSINSYIKSEPSFKDEITEIKFYAGFSGLEAVLYRILKLGFNSDLGLTLDASKSKGSESSESKKKQAKSKSKDEVDKEALDPNTIATDIMDFIKKAIMFLSILTKCVLPYFSNSKAAVLSAFENFEFLRLKATLCIFGSVSLRFINGLSFDLGESSTTKDIQQFTVQVWPAISAYLVYTSNDQLSPITLSSSEGSNDIEDSLRYNLNLRDRLAKFLVPLHKEMGKLYLCEVDQRLFPKLCIEIFDICSLPEAPDEIHQCYFCLFHYSISIKPRFKDRHTHSALPINIATAFEVFEVLWAAISEKVSKGKQINPDHKQILETIKGYINNPMLMQSASMSFNSKNLDLYLEESIDFSKGLKMFSWTSAMPSMGEPGNSQPNLPDIYSKLYFGVARIQFYQHRLKFKQLAIMEEEEWLTTIADFKKHLCICPKSIECWYYLGVSYSEIAKVLVSRKATIMETRGFEIGKYQRKSFLAFRQVAILLRRYCNQGLEPSFLPSKFWSEFADCVYSIISHPADMAAFISFKPTISRLTQSSQKELVVNEISVLPPHKSTLYFLALQLYSKSLALEKKSWYDAMMISKCSWKLGDTSELALEPLIKAISNIPDKSGAEKILEPYYYLLSFSFKGLLSEKMKAEIVIGLIEKGFEGLGDLVQSGGSTHEATKARAMDLILEKLEVLKKIDKKRWYHKVAYLEAKVNFFGLKDYKAAFEALHMLIKPNVNATRFINVWKPPHERAGKFFVYVAQYTTFMFKVLEVEPEQDLMFRLLKKMVKAVESIYRFDKVWKKGIHVFAKMTRARFTPRHHSLIGKRVDPLKLQEILKPFETTIIEIYAQQCSSQPQIEAEYEFNTLNHCFELIRAVANLSQENELNLLAVDLYSSLLDRWGVFELIEQAQELEKSKQLELPEPITIKQVLKFVDRFHKDTLAFSKQISFPNLPSTLQPAPNGDVQVD